MGNSKLLVLLCSHTQLLLCQFNCLYLKLGIFLQFYPFNSLPQPKSYLGLNCTTGLTHITPWASAYCNQTPIRLVWWIQTYWPLKFPDQWSKWLIKFIIELCTSSLLRNIWSDVTLVAVICIENSTRAFNFLHSRYTRYPRESIPSQHFSPHHLYRGDWAVQSLTHW